MTDETEPGTTAPGYVDLHNHLVPGVDDGARDRDEAMRAIGRLADGGVRHILSTPHLDASTIARPKLLAERQVQIEEAWGKIVAACQGRRPALSLHLGREIMLDLPEVDTTDPRVRLAGGPYVLVEFPRLVIPPDSEDVLFHILDQGNVPVIAHVERYRYQDDPGTIWREWREGGAVFQVNLPSLLGRYGRGPRELAWRLLASEGAELVASDYHGRGEPFIREASETLSRKAGAGVLDVLFRENPLRVLRGAELVQPPGFKIDRTLLSRIMGKIFSRGN